MTVALGEAAPDRWEARHSWLLAGGLIAGILARLVLLPTPGLVGDMDLFAAWIHGVATGPLGSAYDQHLPLPPVIVYIWALLGAVQPAFKTVADSSDAAIRALMKTPASLADLGLALGVVLALRRTPRWAVVGGLAVLLGPPIIYVSSWWGQYESIYVLGALVAFLLAASGHDRLAAAALGVALMTKPQALPLAIPFAAWYIGRGGLRGSLIPAAVLVGTVAVLWLPFLPSGGPAAYAGAVSDYQNGLFAVLSHRAWNIWWPVEIAAGKFVPDGGSIVGPITYRIAGFALTALFEAIVFVRVLRDPTRSRLALGLATSALVSFMFLTTMHERYAYAALVFLAVLLPDPRIGLLGLVFGIVYTLNLVTAAPATPWLEALLPAGGYYTLAGVAALLAVTMACLWLLGRPLDPRARDGVPVAPASPRDTSARSAAAIS